MSASVVEGRIEQFGQSGEGCYVCGLGPIFEPVRVNAGQRESAGYARRPGPGTILAVPLLVKN